MLQIALRILRAEIYLKKYIIEGLSIDYIESLTDIIVGRFEYKKDLTEILMEKIRHYELVNPMEVVTFHHILKLEESFINNGAV